MPRRSGPRIAFAVAALSAVTASACGNGLTHEEIVRAASGTPVREQAAGSPVVNASGQSVAGNELAVAEGTTPEQSGTVPAGPVGAGTAATGIRATTSAAGSSPQPAGTRQQPGVSPSAGAAGPVAARGPGEATSAAGGSAASAPAASAQGCAAECKPVVIGSVGTYSGIVGQNVSPGMKTVQAWVQLRNAAGGLGGHRVDLIVADDGSDPARHRSLIQDLVENRGVIAFVYNSAPLSGQASVDYVTAKRIPVIGSEAASPWFYSSPMFFPQASSGTYIIASMVFAPSRIAFALGKKRLGLIHCSDGIQICEDASKTVPRYAPRVGWDHVWTGSGSLAQPDFTAECLAARNAGVEVLMPIMDANSAQRIARSCASVGFKPTFIIGPPILFESYQDDPNFEGAIGSQVIAPWLDVANPSVGEFRAALQRYGSNLDPSGSTGLGWVSAKLFERAARNLPAVPTTAAILDGLWSIRNDDLGGLTYPLTFVRDKIAAPAVCGRAFIIKNAKWQLHPDGVFACMDKV